MVQFDKAMLFQLGGSNNTDHQVGLHVSNEKNPVLWRYIGDYTTQLYRDYNKPL